MEIHKHKYTNTVLHAYRVTHAHPCTLYPVVSKNIAHAWSIVDQILSGENWPLGGGRKGAIYLLYTRA